MQIWGTPAHAPIGWMISEGTISGCELAKSTMYLKNYTTYITGTCKYSVRSCSEWLKKSFCKKNNNPNILVTSPLAISPPDWWPFPGSGNSPKQDTDDTPRQSLRPVLGAPRYHPSLHLWQVWPSGVFHQKKWEEEVFFVGLYWDCEVLPFRTSQGLSPPKEGVVGCTSKLSGVRG